jgi:transcriptional regulator with XRE-family HTH domain
MGTYGERLARALKNKGMSQTEFAEKLGILRTAVSKIVHGAQYLDFDLAVRACEILDIPLEWLAYGDGSDFKPAFHKIPDRQRIEYLLSLLEEADYPLVIVSLEKMIEIRLKKEKTEPVSRKRKIMPAACQNLRFKYNELH